MKRRHFTPAMRRRIEECDEKPGLPAQVIDTQANAAVRRMRVIDAQPEAWRDLLNQYPHQIVAVVAESAGDPEKAQRVLEAQLGRPLSGGY